MVEAILEIKTTLDEAAAEALALFGEGGNPDAPQEEDKIGICATIVLGGYVRILVTEAYGKKLEYIDENGGSEHADLVRVEWPELMPQPVYDEAGDMIDPGGWPPVMVELIGVDENGITYNYQQELGRFA